jgi:M6 family metalloprotease-like protein
MIFSTALSQDFIVESVDFSLANNDEKEYEPTIEDLAEEKPLGFENKINFEINDHFDPNVDVDEIPQGNRIKDDLYVELGGEDAPSSAAIMIRPTTGTVNVLVMPIYFSDQSYSISQSVIDARWDGATGSVCHYYLENSLNLLTINANTLSWIQAPSPIAYYANQAYSNPREFELAQWAFTYWNPTINYNDYNYVYIVYPGLDLQDDTHFWPHVWTFYSGSLSAGDGVSYDKLGFVGENSGMGTYAHEFGHSLGLIDYYSMSGEENCGFWELMDSGNYNGGGNYPAHMSAYSKIELGWIPEDKILDLTPGSVALVKLFHLEAPSCPADMFYAVRVVYSSTYYYLVEFRDNYGYDAYLPDSGVLWSAVDLTKGSTEGRLKYIGGDHSAGNRDLDGVELDDTQTEQGEEFIRWFIGSWEMSVGAIAEYSNHMEVIINLYHDFGTEWGQYEDLPVGNEIYWSYTSVPAGRILVYNWASQYDTDFRIRKYSSGSWVDVYALNDICQDAGYYRVTEAGDYRVVITNDNAMSMDIYYLMYYCNAPSLDVKNFQGALNIDYLPGKTEFQISVETTNYNAAWDDDVTIGLSLPVDIQLQAGETLEKAWATPFKGITTTFTWNLVALSSDFFVISVSLIGTYGSDSLLGWVALNLDETAPLCSFTAAPTFYTSTSPCILSWSVSDPQSGVKNLTLYRNSDPINFFASPATSTAISIPQPGTYIYSLLAYDYANNWRNASIIVVYDNLAPQFDGFLTDISNVPRVMDTLKFLCSDDLAGVNTVEVFVNGISLGFALFNDDAYQISVNWGQYPSSSSVQVEVKIIDRAGNYFSHFAQVRFDSEATMPVPKGQSPDNFPLIGAVVGIAVVGGSVGIFIKRRKSQRFFEPAPDSIPDVTPAPKSTVDYDVGLWSRPKDSTPNNSDDGWV